MAKRKITKRKRSVSRVHKNSDIDFHSWTFFLFLIFVFVATLLLVAQQMGYKFF